MGGGVVDDGTLPTGCFYKESEGTSWFNTNTQLSGQKVSGVKQYCQKGLGASLKGTSVLFLGDSDMDKWPALRSNFGNSHNLGVGGYSCQDVLDEIKGGG